MSIEHGEYVDDVKVKGFEAVRSDTADVTETVQRDVFDIILHDDDPIEDVRQYLSDVYEDASTDMDVRRLAKRGGIGKSIDEYGTPNRRPQPIYRGAKYANDHLDVTITSGDKPQYYYVESVGDELPQTYTAETAEDGDLVDAITLPQGMAPPESVTVDRDTMVEKALVEPLRPIIGTLGLSWSEIQSQTRVTGLEEFV